MKKDLDAVAETAKAKVDALPDKKLPKRGDKGTKYQTSSVPCRYRFHPKWERW